MPVAPLMKAVRSLHFQQDRRAELNTIDPQQWSALLKLTDRSQITLPLGVRCGDHLPDTVRPRIDRNLADNAARHRLIDAEYRTIADALRASSVGFIVLKGLAQIAPLYVPDAHYRPQYDIDLYCPPASVDAAREALIGAGFLLLHTGGKYTDHLPPMIRKMDWKWRGDYYAPDLPLTVELHFRFWDSQTERLPAPCVDQFWSRRSIRSVGGVEVPMLSLADGVSYSALHLVRHLLRGDIRIYHVYELAHFLHQTACDDELWREWAANRAGSPSVVEAVAFRLATEWFGCKTHSVVDEKMARLPADVLRWFDLFSLSPLDVERPNKDELFLHLSLLDNADDRRSVIARRLTPALPAKLIEPGPAGGKRSIRAVINTQFRRARLFATRAAYHARTAANLIPGIYRWKFSGRKYVAF